MPSRKAPENSRVFPWMDAAQRFFFIKVERGSSSPSTIRAIEKYRFKSSDVTTPAMA